MSAMFWVRSQLEPDVFSVDISQPTHRLAKPLPELFRCERIDRQNSDPRYLRLLGDAAARPKGQREAERAKEIASPHSMTSSARASSDGGTVSPSALAVLRLITSSNLVGCCTGKSAGLSPLRMRAA